MTRASIAFVAAISICADALGCSSGASPADGHAGTEAGAAEDSGSSVTFTALYATVIQPNCSSHHSVGAVDGFLDLGTQARAYASFLKGPSGPSCGANGIATIVVAGSAATSLLYEKVATGSPPCGSQMPVGAPLSASDQAMIAAWINGGALDD